MFPFIASALVGSFAIFSFDAQAHPGGVNAEGCHANRKTGEYHCHREASSRPVTKNQAVPSTRESNTCGDKRYCGQMTSCAEAMFYYRSCGVTRLDGDGDGIPCESLCRGRRR